MAGTERKLLLDEPGLTAEQFATGGLLKEFTKLTN